jgi:FkbM family methyltransferase
MFTKPDFTMLFAMLVETRSLHASHTAFHRFMAEQCIAHFRSSPFLNEAATPVDFGPFGKISLPYRKMGAIDSIDLFGLNELVLFAFYNANRGRYRKAVDIGANLGLHTILLSRCGFAVTSYEPDPIHFEWLSGDVKLNELAGVNLVCAAVSDREGTAEFVRVKGNTTGSHLAGAKSNPYGDLDRFPVEIHAFDKALGDADLVKIDAEGHEVIILKSLPIARWNALDAVVEIGTPENAAAVFEHFRGTPVKLFSQKLGWQPAARVEDIPTSHREGSLFISVKSEMHWSA